MTRNSVKLVHEGKFVTEVPVELVEESGGWSPYLSITDTQKLDSIRRWLRSGDVKAASRLARVFELTPVSG